MKKICGIVLLSMIVLFTGCTKNMITCESNNSENDYITMYDIYFNSKDQVNKVNVRMVANDPDNVEEMCDNYIPYVQPTEGTTIKCNDEGIIITGFEKTSDEISESNRDEIIELMEEDDYTCN